MHAYEDPHVGETSPADWKYVAEGGATLVLSYDGAPNPKFSGKVLRLRKCDIHVVFEESPAFWSEPDDPIIQFQSEVVELLLPSENLPELQAVIVERPWLEQIVERVEAFRPTKRRERDRIDVTRHKAVLATDLVGCKGWSVEIKPKWGFLPSPTYLSPQTRDIKTQTCRFCMHTHYRTAIKGEKLPDEFCPLNLYSGDEDRMITALHGLWDGWVHSEGMANSLRIFMEGTGIQPTQDVSLERLASAILPSDVKYTPATLRDEFTTALSRVLLASPVLPTISRLQRTLDALDIEGLHALLNAAGVPFSKEALEADIDANPVFVEPNVQNWIDFVHEYNQRYPSADYVSAPEPTVEDVRYHTLAYLLSMSFKDCSIIINIQPDGSAPPRVTVIDLDPKTVRKLTQWEKLDKQIVDEYAKLEPEQRKKCVDDGAREIKSEPVSTVQFLVVVTMLVTFVSFVLKPW